MPSTEWRWQDGYLIGPRAADADRAYTAECLPAKLVRSWGYNPRETVVPFDGAQRLWLTRFLNCRSPKDFALYAGYCGPLGLATRVEPPLVFGESLITYAESLQAWWDAHRLISTAANLWEASTERRAQDVERLLNTSTEGHLSLELQTVELSVCGTHRFAYSEQAPEKVTFADRFAFARRASASLANALLREHSSPQVLVLDAGPAALTVTTHNKLGAMAGELSLWMTGVRRYAVCPGCGVWNDLTSSHPSRTHCSGSRGVNCRKRHSRRSSEGRT